MFSIALGVALTRLARLWESYTGMLGRVGWEERGEERGEERVEAWGARCLERPFSLGVATVSTRAIPLLSQATLQIRK